VNLVTLNNVGSLAAIALVVVLLQRYRSLPHVRPLPRYGLAGAWLLMGSMALSVAGIVPVGIFLTPLCWTGYILWADGAVAALRGHSLISDNRRAFWLLASASVPLWIIFELYNVRLDNWVYAGLPNNPVLRYAGYVWAFATIWPGILVTAALLRAMDYFTTEDTEGSEITAEKAKGCRSGIMPVVSIVVGAAFLISPPLLPPEVGAYLFGAVWLGPFLLLDPLNMRAGRDSLWADLRRGDRTRLSALLWTGAICGLLWEFWNHAAMGRWVYTFPIFQDYRMFAMPLPGYLGFPAFALDCFAMYALVEPWLLRLTRTPDREPKVLSL
jgi:hypothetical protein